MTVVECRKVFAALLATVELALAYGRRFLAAGLLTSSVISVGFALSLSAVYGLGKLMAPLVADYLARLQVRPAHQRA